MEWAGDDALDDAREKLGHSAPWRTSLVLLFCLLQAGAALGHPPGVPSAKVTAVSSAVVVDGAFDEPAWSKATWQHRFVERKPSVGAIPKDATSFAIIYDAAAIYVAVRMADTDPTSIVAKTLTRDSFNLFNDDAISLKLDPHHDHRTTYGFAVNAGDGKLDYKGINESKFERGFDMVWSAATARTKAGWNAEFRIPWTALGIDPSKPPPEMGLNLSRDHPRRNATYDWAAIRPPYGAISASQYGQLVGFKPVKGATARIDWALEPYLLGGFLRRRGGDGSLSPSTPMLTEPVYDAGLDASIQVGESFGLHLTINTDFAQVDLDDQVVNLTRFGLFIEEKRDFFVADAELFTFGRSSEAQLLYTRRIGLTGGGVQVPLLTGLKAVGRPSKGVRVGLLHVTTRPLDSEGLPWESHLVARAQLEGGDGSSGGIMATWRQSYEGLARHNIVVGADGTWRGSGTPFLVNAFALLSLTGADAAAVEAGTGGRRQGTADTPAPAVGLDLTYRDPVLRPRFQYAYYAPEFRADLGYFRRVGGHEPGIGFDYIPRFNRNGIERLQVSFDVNAWVWDDLDTDGASDGESASTGRFDWNAELEAVLYWEVGFAFGVQAGIGRAAVLNTFFLGADTEIAPEDFVSSSLAVAFSSPAQEVVATEITLRRRDFFGGVLYGVEASLAAKPSSLFRLDLSAGYDYGDFAPDPSSTTDRSFHSATINARMTFGFTPDIGASLYTGWNYLADRIRLQARLRWSYLPGSDLFVVYQLDGRPEPFAEAFQSLLVKLTFRYPFAE